MEKKYWNLIWAVILLTGICLAFLFGFNAGNKRSSALPPVSSQPASSIKDAASNTTSAAEKKSDITLAAAKTQLLDSQANFSYRLEEKSAYLLPQTGKYVYLTFDDGPSCNTPAVLKILKQNNIKATFFVIHNKNPEYYRQIAADGHTLALHTYTHNYAQIYTSTDAYFKDLNRISDYVYGITGIRSKIVRLPGGSSNTISRHYSKGVMTKITQELTQKNYLYYDWNAQCIDATEHGISAKQVLHNVESFTSVDGQQKPFIILLMHNAETETGTRDALQPVIDYYRENGYQFEQITSDTPCIHQQLQN